MLLMFFFALMLVVMDFPDRLVLSEDNIVIYGVGLFENTRDGERLFVNFTYRVTCIYGISDFQSAILCGSVSDHYLTGHGIVEHITAVKVFAVEESRGCADKGETVVAVRH